MYMAAKGDSFRNGPPSPDWSNCLEFTILSIRFRPKDEEYYFVSTRLVEPFVATYCVCVCSCVCRVGRHTHTYIHTRATHPHTAL